jgi:mgtE-like transporter
VPATPAIVASWRRLLGSDPAAARQGFAALMVGLVASLVAGLTLGGINETLERLPGLLVLIPAAIALRGTIFGAMGSRLGTSIHTGTYRLTTRTDSVLGQNVLAAGVLSVFASVVLAVLASALSSAFGVEGAISVADFITISIVGGLLSSAVVLVLTVALAETSVRAGWDFDNVMAPLVTASGDMVTLPALFLATFLVTSAAVANVVAAVAVTGAVVALVVAFRWGRAELRGILREAMVVVVMGGLLSLFAGLVLEGQLESLVTYPALLALVPAFLASAGAIGGMLSSRLTTKLHLGVISSTSLPGSGARADIALAYLLAVPVFALASVVADLAAVVINLPSPGPLAMLGVALLGGLLATTMAVAVAYWGAIASYRLGLDPDNIGIPLVTSSIDLMGSFSFIFAVVVFVT